jgi:ribosomal protein S18 acetylase RimI-like enzyme
MFWGASKVEQLSQISDEELEKGLVFERVRLAYARLRAVATGGWVLKEGPVEVWACPFIDIFNGLISPAWPEASEDELWPRAVSLYRQTGQGMFVSFGPGSHCGRLRERIQRDGFRRCSSVPFMHLELARLQEHPCPEGVRVERIRDFSFFEKHEHPWLGPVGAPFRKWKLQFLRGYGEGDAPRLWQFLAFYQRKIVGAATIFAHGDEIALFDVVVMRSYRQRGIGTRLVVVACDFARSIGMRAVGLSATGKGLGMYRKVGFTDAGSYTDFFLSREGLDEIGR